MSSELPLNHELSTWEKERSRFNHHRLKNQFENHLGAFVSMLAGNLGMEPIHRGEYERLKTEWLELRGALEALVRRFHDEGGPCRFFLVSPLNSLPPEVASWMEPLTREMWWRRVGGEDLVMRVRELLEACDGGFGELDGLAIRTKNPGGGKIRPSLSLMQAGERFHREVHELSEALTRMKQRSYVDT